MKVTIEAAGYRPVKKGEKAGICCCSNGQKRENQPQIEKLVKVLDEIGIEAVLSPWIYADASGRAAEAKERAQALMDFYRDPEIKIIFDISGGDLANEILPYLDYDLIRKSSKQFYGYSDLSVILNALYTKSGVSSGLYQIRNIVRNCAEKQILDVRKSILKEEVSVDGLFCCEADVLQGEELLADGLSGTLAGGNIRCFLKLAGTSYWPDVTGKILLLESLGGEAPRIVTGFAQLFQMGVFDQVKGVILGTFTELEQAENQPSVWELLKPFVPEALPIMKTPQIGHGSNSKALMIGGRVSIRSEEISD